jgi:choline dehydrogenase-like flavoprotein
MVYIRGQAEDFNHWRQLGNSGWSFDDVLPYFRRSEHQVRGANELHGTGGPLCVSEVAQHPICEASSQQRANSAFPGMTTSTAPARNPRRCCLTISHQGLGRMPSGANSPSGNHKIAFVLKPAENLGVPDKNAWSQSQQPLPSVALMGVSGGYSHCRSTISSPPVSSPAPRPQPCRWRCSHACDLRSG